MANLTKTEASDVYDLLDEGDSEDFELAPARDGRPAKFLPIRAASAAEYVKYVVRRIPEVEALYVDQIRDAGIEAKAKADAEEAAAKAARGEVEEVPFGTRPAPGPGPAATAPAAPQATPAEPIDPVTQLMVTAAKVNIAPGVLEEKAALVAVCAGRPGDAEFERRILGHSRFPALAARCSNKTRGIDPFAFSSAVAGVILNQLALDGVDPAAAEETAA